MIPQNIENRNLENEINAKFVAAIRDLRISHLLHECNIRKTTRILDGEQS